jgi:nitric oxide reductase NorE protein
MWGTNMAADRGRAAPISGIGAATPRMYHVPGEVGIWVFVLSDMLLEFSTIFGYFLYARAKDPALFAQGRATLSQQLGLVNTLILLTSSMFAVLGIQALRDGDRSGAARMFSWTRSLGLAFVAVKILEYGNKFHAGLTPVTNAFYMYYFVATGLHLFHVLIGLIVLTYVVNGARKPRPHPNELRSAEVAATFWHMVDLVWIVLFPLLYLVS